MSEYTPIYAFVALILTLVGIVFAGVIKGKFTKPVGKIFLAFGLLAAYLALVAH